MQPRHLIVTGPLDSLDEYAAAARAEGWRASEFPLLRVEPAATAEHFALDAPCAWICVTSRHALPLLERLCAREPALARVPCFAVGERTAAALEALGLRLAHAPCADADELAHAVLAASQPGERVLWPRGDRSDALAQRLRAAQRVVVDPIAYTTRERDDLAAPPPADAVFFASPSGVQAWHAHAAAWFGAHQPGEHRGPRLAIAIGATTFEALLAETRLAFFDTISLPRPSPEALRQVLAHLVPPPR